MRYHKSSQRGSGMLHTTTFNEFVRLNHGELRSMVGSICKKYEVRSIDDVVQDVCIHLYTHNIIEKYDPSYRGQNKTAKISTYLYPILRNIVRSRRRCSDYKYYKSRWVPYDCPHGTGNFEEYTSSSCIEDDDIDLAMRYEQLDANYKNVMSQDSISKNPDELKEDLDSFGRYLEKKNKKFSLKRRRDKSKNRNGCSLTEIYFMFREGQNIHEIAQYYGVSDTFILNLKKIIRNEMKKYGLNWKFPKKKRRHGRNKVSSL